MIGKILKAPSSSNPETATIPTRRLPTLHEFSIPGGLLSKARPNYEFRLKCVDLPRWAADNRHQRRFLLCGLRKLIHFFFPNIFLASSVFMITGFPPPGGCTTTAKSSLQSGPAQP